MATLSNWAGFAVQRVQKKEKSFDSYLSLNRHLRVKSAFSRVSIDSSARIEELSAARAVKIKRKIYDKYGEINKSI